MERSSTRAFGYEFTHIPESIRDDLGSIEREGALYADHWIDDLQDFRHVRIALTESEAKDYARRTWAYELWLRAGQPKWVRYVPEIDPDVATEADAYTLVNFVDGTRTGPPCHCFAAFLGQHLEALACGAFPDRESVIELQGRESALFTLERAVQALTPTMRAFNSREKCLQPWPISREDDVRDLLYVMLRPALFDLVKEEPTPSLAGTHKFVDLASRASGIFIEIKWLGRKGRWRRVLGQMQIDIQSYPTHPACETLVFVVVDAVRDVPDPRLVERQMTGRQFILGRQVDVRLYIVEP